MKKLLLLLGLAAGGYAAWQNSLNKIAVDIHGKVVIITGASAGIGKATAHAFSAYGAKVVLVARRADVLEEVKTELASYGNPILVAPADVTKEADLQSVIDATVREFGRIDILVNNAGLSGGGWLTTNNPDEIRRMIDVNIYAVIRLTQLTLPVMLKQKGGHIVNVSSVASFVGSPGQAPYGATKAAVAQFSESLRREYRRRRIRVSNVMPGWTKTEMTSGMDESRMREAKLVSPLFPMEQPETIAEAIVDSVRFNRRHTIVGGIGFKLSYWVAHFSPRLGDGIYKWYFDTDKVTDTLTEFGA